MKLKQIVLLIALIVCQVTAYTQSLKDTLKTTAQQTLDTIQLSDHLDTVTSPDLDTAYSLTKGEMSNLLKRIKIGELAQKQNKGLKKETILLREEVRDLGGSLILNEKKRKDNKAFAIIGWGAAGILTSILVFK